MPGIGPSVSSSTPSSYTSNEGTPGTYTRNDGTPSSYTRNDSTPGSYIRQEADGPHGVQSVPQDGAALVRSGNLGNDMVAALTASPALKDEALNVGLGLLTQPGAIKESLHAAAKINPPVEAGELQISRYFG